MKYKILHLPTATYMYWDAGLKTNNRFASLFSQYEIEKGIFSLLNPSPYFESKEIIEDYFAYYKDMAHIPIEDRIDDFIFSEELSNGEGFNFIVEHFEIIEINNEM
jgi:hypothetical protein